MTAKARPRAGHVDCPFESLPVGQTDREADQVREVCDVAEAGHRGQRRLHDEDHRDRGGPVGEEFQLHRDDEEQEDLHVRPEDREHAENGEGGPTSSEDARRVAHPQLEEDVPDPGDGTAREEERRELP